MKYVEFFLAPAAAAGLYCAAPNVWWLFAGLVLWTFIEYAVHRAMHMPHMWRSHHQHHAHPLREPPPLFWPFWLGFASLFALIPPSLLSGLTVGYAVFITVHRVCHFARWLPVTTLLDHHDKHHHGHPNANFGVSTRLWDVLFGTAK